MDIYRASNYCIITMNKSALKADLLLLITSAIWGFAFVAQRAGMEHIGPFTYNGIRFAIGSISLLPVITVQNKKAHSKIFQTADHTYPIFDKSQTFFLNTLLTGTVLFIGASLQQAGIQFTTAGKAGFLTGLYVVLVPIAGILIGHKTNLPTWIGTLFAFAGLYFLSSPEHNSSINPGDILVIVSAFFWSFHVLIIDRLAKKIDAIKLAAAQFAWCSLFSLITAVLFEHIVYANIIKALLPILYGGLCSVGIAYTLQIVAQKDAPPAHASILLCLEGVFAMLGGTILLSEPLTVKNISGSSLMLAGMLATQWDVIFSHSPKTF